MDDVDFMLRRAIGICLTDSKSPLVDGRSTHLSPDSLANAMVSRVFYRPLLFLLNALKVATSFRQCVLGYIELAIEHLDASAPTSIQSGSAIDWERTIESRRHGHHDIALSAPEPLWSDLDRLLLSLVLVEFQKHCELLLNSFQTQDILPHGAFLKQCLDKLRAIIIELETVVQNVVKSQALPLDQARRIIENPLHQLSNALASLRDPNNHSCFVTYRDCTNDVFMKLTSRVKLVADVGRWREHYLSFTSGVGPGKTVGYVQARDAAHLFEIWCFSEVASALIECGHSELLQSSMLRSSTAGPTFQINKELDVFYNFYGTEVLLPRGSKLFRNTHVEWFLQNRCNYRESVVVDTKYSKWSVEESFTVLGYMNDFDVDRGVVIFRHDIRPDAFRGVQSNERFVLCQFGVKSEKLFCALTLKPDEANMTRNQEILREFIQRMVTP